MYQVLFKTYFDINKKKRVGCFLRLSRSEFNSVIRLFRTLKDIINVKPIQIYLDLVDPCYKDPRFYVLRLYVHFTSILCTFLDGKNFNIQSV